MNAAVDWIAAAPAIIWREEKRKFVEGNISHDPRCSNLNDDKLRDILCVRQLLPEPAYGSFEDSFSFKVHIVLMPFDIV